MKSPLFGQLLSEGIRSVKARSGRNIRDIETDIAQELGYSVETVRHWRKGNVPTDEE